MYKSHEQFYLGYGRMSILINIVFAGTILLFPLVLFSYFLTHSCEENVHESQ